jgi:glycosyltransferase involved in cell wall biosynthesis
MERTEAPGNGTDELQQASSGGISVVMPCYNAAPYVKQAVRSALSQDYREVELIAVDDGSSDGSREILASLARQYPGRLTLLSTDRKGPYPARNLALERAKGRFIAFLDADDYWEENCLSTLRRAIVEHGADVAYSGWQNVGDGAPGTNPCIPADYLATDPVEEFLRSCPWPIHAALVRRELIDALGGFSERLFSSMDYDLWLRVLAHTRKIVRVPAVLAFYRWHSHGQISKVKWRQVQDARSVRLDFLHRHPELTAHLPVSTVRDLTDGVLLREGYRAYWKRDLDSAQPLFRAALSTGAWQVKDLRYVLPSLFPAPLYRRLIAMVDRSSPEPTT